MALLINWIDQINHQVNGFVWGKVMIVFLLLTGIYFTIGTGFFQLRHLNLWMQSTLFALFRNKQVHEKNNVHNVSEFGALATALAGTIGTGNIVGVATAIASGGVGAVFWMWISAFFGMMTKYAENVLGNRYRYRNDAGAWVGGPMVYIERGLHCKWLAVLFALFCMLASFGIGNMTQANSIAQALSSAFHIVPLSGGILIALCTGLVIRGGLGRIASVTEKLVPLMAGIYLLGGCIIIAQNHQQLPYAISQIITQAFSLEAVGGGVGGYVMMNAVRFGVARGIFSNEAGLGSSVIVNSASNVKDPVQQGMWGMLEVFLDTMVVCTITALAIITSGAHLTEAQGAALSIAAFSSGFGSAGGMFVSIAIACFAFSTILGWCFYGESAMRYLFGSACIRTYQWLFIGMTLVGAVGNLRLIWSVSDTFNGLMALPNLLAILCLSGEVFAVTLNGLQQRAAYTRMHNARQAFTRMPQKINS